MSKKADWKEIDANGNETLTRFFNRTNWEPVHYDVPFDELIATASDGVDGEVGEYEIRQRMVGVKVFFRFLKSKGLHPAAMLKQLAAVGRAIHEEPFHAMTMHEVAMMFSETPAAHSWRCKQLSGEIKLAGMNGSRLPGQKTEGATASYKECRKGNTNRRGGKKAAKRDSGKARQSSFLKKLHVPTKHQT
jgi:hypothetical protein